MTADADRTETAAPRGWARAASALGHTVGARVRAIRPAVALALASLALFVYGYPGQLGPDALAALRQARSKFFSDAYAPAFSALWRQAELVVAGPTAMLVVQTALFVFGAHAVLRRALSPRGAAWATAALAVFPPVAVAFTTIGAPTLAASLVLVAVGARLGASDAKGLVGPRVAVALLVLATAVLPSAAVATLPLVVAGLPRRDATPRARRIVRALVAWLAIGVVAVVANLALAHQPSHAWHAALSRADLIGTLAHVEPDADTSDGALRAMLAGTGLRIDHDVQLAARAIALPDDASMTPGTASTTASLFDVPSDGSAPPPAQRDALACAARQLAFAHPGAYLRNRLAVYAAVLWLDEPHVATAVRARGLPDAALKLGIPSQGSAVQDTVTAWWAALAEHTPLFAPWLYLALGLITFVLKRRDREVVALLASGLAWAATLAFTATTTSYDAWAWPLVAIALAIVVGEARPSRGRAPAPATPEPAPEVNG